MSSRRSSRSRSIIRRRKISRRKSFIGGVGRRNETCVSGSAVFGGEAQRQ